MGVSDDISSLSNQIGKGGMTESAIRSKLSLIEDQAKAQETELKEKDSKITLQEKELTKLYLEVHKQEQAPEADRLHPEAEQVLVALSGTPRPGLEKVAIRLGLKQVVAEYHANTLVDKDMIELAAYAPGKGTIYSMRPKGTAYIVENNLG